MKGIIIFNSQTGFTKKYAEWLRKSTNFECFEFKKAKRKNLSEYDTIIFASWLMAGTLSKLNWFKKKLTLLSNKKIIIVAIGGSPAENPDNAQALSNLFTQDELSNTNIKSFYCPGGLNYEKMNFFSKSLMKMFVTMLLNKKDASKNDIKAAKMMSKSYDISDKKHIEKILTEINN